MTTDDQEIWLKCLGYIKSMVLRCRKCNILLTSDSKECPICKIPIENSQFEKNELWRKRFSIFKQ